MSVVTVSKDFGGRTLTLETGRLAKQADASVLVTYGETVVLVTAVSSREFKEGQDFFPLTVDYQEKYYAAGRIPGGFFKREAKPSDFATLSARMTDRPIRPLFPEDYMFDTQIVATVLSTDGENEPNLCASIGASAALHMSDIPFNGPIAAVRIGKIDGELVLNVTPEQQAESGMDLLVNGGREGIVMVEGQADEATEAEMMDALDFASESIQPILDLQDELREKTGNVTKREYKSIPGDDALKAEMKSFLDPKFAEAFAIREKLARYAKLDEVKSEAKEKFVKEEASDEDKVHNHNVKRYLGDLKAEWARNKTLDSKERIDGRPYDQIRPINTEVGILPRAHGSGVFTRGETQVLSVVTLGSKDDQQKIDSINGQYNKTFLLHYNFPPFSVGEARFLRGPGRREIGHGFLAERALEKMLPDADEFPYTVRLVAEVLESNGSSSMATVCSGALALMDAGVPIKKPVAGVAMGLIKEGEKLAVLSDILGDEDHLGDMDFKVTGSADGITAFQMDLKIGGVTREIMETALEQARQGRLHILEKMEEHLNAPREEMSAYAPRIHTLKVKPEKVREVIGPGGKVIKGIIEQTGVKIDIEDDGTVNIFSHDGPSAESAINMVEEIVQEAEPGKVYEGTVSRIADFGAFIEIFPGTDGLCHISELDHHRVERVEDVLNVGDAVEVKCLEVDDRGKIRLSRKALLEGSLQDQGGPPYDLEEDDTQPIDLAADDEGDHDGPKVGEGPRRVPRGRGGRSSGGRGGDRGRSSGGRGGRGGDRGRSGGGRGRGGDRDGNRFESRGGGRDRDDRGGRGGDRDRGGRDRDRGGRGDRDGNRGGGGYGRGGDREDRGNRFESRGGGRDRDRDRGGRGDRDGNRDYDRGGDDRGNRFESRGGGRDRDDRGGRGDRGGYGRGDRDGNRSGGRGGRGGRSGGSRGGRSGGGRGERARFGNR